MAELCARVNPRFPDVVQLNVGGRFFATTRETLCRVKGSLLEFLFTEERFKLRCDTTGMCYIDRNGDTFALILDWLRTSILPSGLSSYQEELFRAELKFWRLQASLESREPATSKSSQSDQVAVDGFIESAYVGSKPGYVYKKDYKGLGYYLDDQYHAIEAYYSPLSVPQLKVLITSRESALTTDSVFYVMPMLDAWQACRQEKSSSGCVCRMTAYVESSSTCAELDDVRGTFPA